MNIQLASTPLAWREAAAVLSDIELAAIAEHIEIQAWQDLILATPLWLRISLQLIAEEQDGVLTLASGAVPSLLLNRVVGLGKRPAPTDQQIRGLLDRYNAMGIANYWIQVGPHAQPRRLSRMLQGHGLRPYRRSWVKMVRPARRVQAMKSQLTLRAANHRDAHDVASILGPAFDLPQRGAEIITGVLDRPRWTTLVAELNSEIVAAASMFIEGEMAYLAFAATRAEFRRLGAQRALMQARINMACDAGCRWLATETGFPLTADEPQPSYHNMLWAGFRPVEIRDNYAPPGARWMSDE